VHDATHDTQSKSASGNDAIYNSLRHDSMNLS
jgi:hypothetical protein